jgi:hypothetical protein
MEVEHRFVVILTIAIPNGGEARAALLLNVSRGKVATNDLWGRRLNRRCRHRSSGV